MAVVIAMYYAVSWTLQTNTRRQLCRRKIDLFQVNSTHARILVNDKKSKNAALQAVLISFMSSSCQSFMQFYCKLISFKIVLITYYDNRVTFHSIVHLCTPAFSYRSAGNCY